MQAIPELGIIISLSGQSKTSNEFASCGDAYDVVLYVKTMW
jgi:hypothetical protein